MDETNNPNTPEEKVVATEAENLPTEETTEEATVTVDDQKLAAYMDRLKLEQNLPLAIGFGFFAMLAGALLWAAITVVTEYQIGYMAIAIGFLVGFAIRYGGKGFDQIFGISGAVLSLIGCALGNLLSTVGFIGNENGISYFEVLEQLDMALVSELMTITFSPMDILFYGIALYYGYKLSFRKLSDEEIIEHGT